MARTPQIATPPSDLLAAVDAPASLLDALGQYVDLGDRLTAADQLKAELERKVIDAEDADIAARAVAAEQEGKTAPAAGTKKIEAAKAERDAQAREVAGLELARDRARSRFEQAAAEHATELGETIAAQVTEQRARFGECLDQLQAVHDGLAGRQALRGWLAGDATGTPGRWRPASYLGRLESLTAPSGEPLTPADALAALREVTEAPLQKVIESEGVQAQRTVERNVELMEREAERRGVPVGALASTPVRDYQS